MTNNIKHFIGKETYVRQMSLKQFEKVRKHIHTYDHYSILAYGIVVVKAGNEMNQFIGPTVIEIKSGVEHEVLAMTDAVWFCVHGTTEEINDLDGVKIE
jgi:hypothetical protein